MSKSSNGFALVAFASLCAPAVNEAEEAKAPHELRQSVRGCFFRWELMNGSYLLRQNVKGTTESQAVDSLRKVYGQIPEMVEEIAPATKFVFMAEIPETDSPRDELANLFRTLRHGLVECATEKRLEQHLGKMQLCVKMAETITAVGYAKQGGVPKNKNVPWHTDQADVHKEVVERAYAGATYNMARDRGELWFTCAAEIAP